MSNFLEKSVIIGVAESDLGKTPDFTELELHAQAASRAIEDAGIKPSDIDGVLSMSSSRLVRMPSVQVAEYLGLQPSFTDSTSMGGASFEAMVQHACMAIAAGICKVCLITYGSTQRTYRSRSLAGGSAASWLPQEQFDGQYGLPLMVGAYALAAQRHMDLYGTKPEDLAEIAVAARKWAQLNPKAYKRDPLTVADVLNSDVVSTPLHKLDCCLVTDGGGAVIVAAKDRYSELKKPGVFVWGAAETHSHVSIVNMPELTQTPAHVTAKKALSQAGIGVDDIDVAEIYDSFTITTLMTLEDIGFCEKGEGGQFVRNGRIYPGGDFPLNTQGGGLSYTHPGMFGIFLLIEGVRQIRGECGERQVPNVNLVLCHGTGGALSTGATVILGKEAK